MDLRESRFLVCLFVCCRLHRLLHLLERLQGVFFFFFSYRENFSGGCFDIISFAKEKAEIGLKLAIFQISFISLPDCIQILLDFQGPNLLLGFADGWYYYYYYYYYH
jgi:hypothetical protein